MVKLEISILKSVNGVKFGSSPFEVHKVLGDDFKKEEKKEISKEGQSFLEKICMDFAKATGKPLENYTKYITDDKYDFDEDDDNTEYYPFCTIEYDQKNRFESIEIYSDQNTQLIIDGKDCSDFDLQKFLTLANDFVSEENNTAWTSYSKQIGIWCPDGDARVECVLFGKPSYYTE